MFHPASFGSGGDGAATGGKGGGIIEISTRRLQVIMGSIAFKISSICVKFKIQYSVWQYNFIVRVKKVRDV